MTPKQSRMLWLAVIPCLLLTAVILWFGSQLLREGIYHVVGTPTQQDKGHNAYETLAVKQCDKQAQAGGQQSASAAKTCGYAEEPAEVHLNGVMLIWGAIFLAFVPVLWKGLLVLLRLVRGR